MSSGTEPPSSLAETGIPVARRRWLKAWPRAALAVPLAIGLLWLGYAAIASALHNRHVRWAREIALPEIERLVSRDEWPAAFSLARAAEKYIPGDPLLAEARRGPRSEWASSPME